MSGDLVTLSPASGTQRSQKLLDATSATPALTIAPFGLRVEGRRVLIVGAGRIAARKAAALAAVGAELVVVAPEHGPEMAEVAAVERHRRPFDPTDLDDVWLAVTATGIPDVDGEVYRAAEQRRIWCNAADDPTHCSAILPAVARHGDVTVSIATGGRSPAGASWLRRRITALLQDGGGEVVESAAELRRRLRAAGRPTEVEAWPEVMAELERRLFLAPLVGSAPADPAPADDRREVAS